jgi:hypothetical protein
MNDVQEHHLTKDRANHEFYRTRDQRSPMETMFTKRDIEKHVSDPRQQWRMKRAMSLQEGQYVNQNESMKPRSVQNSDEWKRRQTQIITNQCGLTDGQADDVEWIMSELPKLNRIFGPYGLNEIIVGTAAYVLRHEKQQNESVTLLQERDAFSLLEDEYDATDHKISVVIDKIEEYVAYPR